VDIGEFLLHGKSVAGMGFEYFRKQFLEPGGNYTHIMKCYSVASSFNPLKAAKISKADLEVLADWLEHFGYEEFTPLFIGRLKKELDDYITAVQNSEDDLSNIEGASAWKDASANRGKDWRKCPPEVARRIWMWGWRLHHSNSSI
jgi:hypothetical protein